MKVLFDINHPAHVHFFRNPAAILKANGHDVVFTSREKDVALDLLNQYNLPHTILSSFGRGGLLSLVRELFSRNRALYRFVKQQKPDVMASIGGTFIAHVGAATGIPSIVFYDTENAKLQNLITYPFASRVIVPEAYHGWLPKNHLRYQGYHEISYLHPKYFTPDREIALQCGLDPCKQNILIRLVAWKANHDLGEVGWTRSLLTQIVGRYSTSANIIISSELSIGKEFERYLYKGKANDMHHLMAFCKLFVGESATMASEAAVLGVPAIYAAKTGRGYTDEQEKKYGLVQNVECLDFSTLTAAIDASLDLGPECVKSRAERMLSESVDVADYVSRVLVDSVISKR